MLKISNQSRVERILRRVCQASLQVIIRAGSQRGVAVKGRASHIVNSGKWKAIRIANISDRGMQHIMDAKGLQIEFIMMSTKVVFTAPIASKEQNAVILRMPQVLFSLERRKNARYGCSQEVSAFLELSIWKPNAMELTAPPSFPHYSDLGGQLWIADASFGGVCAVSRFPAINSVLRRGLIDDAAKLFLPMRAPLEVALEVRWFKRIREHSKDPAVGEESSFLRSYRFGVEFISPSEEVLIQLRHFFQQINQAGAI